MHLYPAPSEMADHIITRTYRCMHRKCFHCSRGSVRRTTSEFSRIIRFHSNCIHFRAQIHKAFKSVWYGPCHNAVVLSTGKFRAGPMRRADLFNCKNNIHIVTETIRFVLWQTQARTYTSMYKNILVT